jgi:hypothetical protein
MLTGKTTDFFQQLSSPNPMNKTARLTQSAGCVVARAWKGQPKGQLVSSFNKSSAFHNISPNLVLC